MNKRLFLLFGFIIILSNSNGQFFVKNYTSKDYNASVSNWYSLTDQNGVLFTANFEGLLYFNSQIWNHLKSEALLSLAKDSANRIYYGSVSGFGYIQIKSNGELNLKPLIKNGNPTWDICICNNDVYFFSKKVIYKLSNGELSEIEKDNLTFNYRVNCLNHIPYVLTNNGIFRLDNETIVLKKTNQISDETVVLLTNYKKGSKIITSQSGSFYLHQDSIVNINRPEFQIFSADPFEQKLAVSTPNEGIIVADQDLNKIAQITKSQGLISNTVKSIHVDKSSNFWSSLREGISYVEYGSPVQPILEHKLDGIISTLHSYDSLLLIGTTEGMYKTILSDNTADKIFNNSITYFEKTKVPGELKVYSNSGLHKYKRQTLFKNKDTRSATVGLSTDMYQLIFNNRGIVIKAKDKPDRVINLSDMTFIDSKLRGNEVWATAKFKGIYHILNLNNNHPTLIHFNEKNGLPDVEEIHLIEHENQILFTTSKGLYQYKPENADSIKFIKYDGKLNPSGHLKHAEKDSLGNYYFTIKEERTDRLEQFQLQPDGSYKRIYKPFRRLPEMVISVVYPQQDSTVLIAGTEGLFKYDMKIKKDYDISYNTLTAKVTTNDSLIFGGFYAGYTEGNEIPYITIRQPDSAKPKLNYENNNLTFEYAAAFYELPEKTEFSYFLKNNDRDWSKWTSDTKKEYTNLPAGEYTFMVKSKNIYDKEGEIASYSFTILPPWYQTTWAYIGFIILAILFIWFVSLIYTFRVRMQRRKLKLIVADRTFEVIQQKKEIESQNNLLKQQNAEITLQKEQIQEKNAELQTSQEEILTINDQLKELNLHLEKKVDQRTRKIKATVEKLKKVNQELDTFVYRASHDLKGPISRIHGLTSLAKLESTAETDQKYYELIERAALDMQGLLSKLSNAYEIMNKKLTPEKVDIPFLLSEIRNSIKFLDNGTKYSFDIAEQLTLVTDIYLLKLIIENLIENALIFRKPETQHEIKIKCSEAEGFFYFQIVDNGIGIEPTHYEQIYHMFFRGSDKSKGSGLGLYIVKTALDKLQGEISLDSTLFQYSSFTIKIPLQ